MSIWKKRNGLISDWGPTMRTTIMTPLRSPIVLLVRHGTSARNLRQRGRVRVRRYCSHHAGAPQFPDTRRRTSPAADLFRRPTTPTCSRAPSTPSVRHLQTPPTRTPCVRDASTRRKKIADKFKEGQPVIMNLEASDREVSRRLIDFASGLCYGLNGTMEKVATGVYLLKPIPPRKGGGYDSGEFEN